MSGKPRSDMLPVAPLVEALERRAEARREPKGRGGWSGVANLFGENYQGLRKHYHVAKTRGTISPELADKIAIIILGMHPYNIYGELWLVGVEDE